jgi:O-antigen ligase
MGLLKILFLIVVLIFPFAEVARLQFTNGVAVSLNDLMIFAFVGVWFIYKLVSKSKFKTPKLKRPLLIFTLIAGISLLVNVFNLSQQGALVSALYLVRWIFYALVYYIILEFDLKFRIKALKALLVSGFIVVILGYVQYFFYPNLRNLYYLGWDDHLYRMFSTFLDPNFAGTFFVIYFLFTLNHFLLGFKKQFTLSNFIILAACVLSLGAVYLTYSRSAFFMLLVALISYLWLKGKRKILIGILFILVLFIFLSPAAFKHENTNFLRSVSSNERIKSANQAILVFLKNPVIGVGFNAYRYILNKDFGYNGGLWQTSHAGAGTDNSFLFVLATTGLIGFTAFIFLIYKMLMLAREKIKSTHGILVISIILGLIINSIFINSFFYVLVLEWIWILVGITENS